MDGNSPASEGEGCRSLDDLVGTGEDRRRDRQAKRLGGLEVYDQLEGRRLLNRQIGRLSALQKLSRVNPGLGIDGVHVSTIADQAARCDPSSVIIDRRYGMTRCQRH